MVFQLHFPSKMYKNNYFIYMFWNRTKVVPLYKRRLCLTLFLKRSIKICFSVLFFTSVFALNLIIRFMSDVLSSATLLNRTYWHYHPDNGYPETYKKMVLNECTKDFQIKCWDFKSSNVLWNIKQNWSFFDTGISGT